MAMFMHVPKLTYESRHLESIISPRSHHMQTLERYNTQTRNLMRPHQPYCSQSIRNRVGRRENQYNSCDQSGIDSMTRPFHLLMNSVSHHLTHSRSLSSETANTSNKFYSFKRIREQKCRQKNFEGKVIKSMRVTPEPKPFKKRVIQHLDEIETTQSKESPRQSLNSLVAAQVQQSQIIMRGADLYDDLLRQNGIKNSVLFPQSIQVVGSAFETPKIRKQLSDSMSYLNTVDTLCAHYFTEPKRVICSGKMSKISLKSQNCLLRHPNLEIEKNSLSFLKNKNFERRL